MSEYSTRPPPPPALTPKDKIDITGHLYKRGLISREQAIGLVQIGDFGAYTEIAIPEVLHACTVPWWRAALSMLTLGDSDAL